MLEQIAIFAENQKGAMHRITSVLARNNINILGSVTNDSAEYGIIRMLVSDPPRTMQVLTEAGYICKLTDVLGVECEDRVGALNYLLEALDESNISVDYLYLSFDREKASPIMVLHVEDPTEVEDCLSAKGFHLL